AKYSEQARVAVRNVRRDGMDQLKKLEKAGEMSQDDHKIWGEEFQNMTDGTIAKIDKIFEEKQAEIMQV
ncbi:MAG TPA: ribosome-recycling factor, partial [Alphaproteobacteria bacterium]|nr:ribosome-recycling factor [Alphaproteobacteria bacterium]